MSGNDKTIQQKLADLSQKVAWFEGDEFSLDEAMEKFRAAEKLAEEIEEDLNQLKNEVVVLKQKFSEGE